MPAELMFAFTYEFIALLYLYLVIKWLVIGGGIAGAIWLIYRAGKVGMFSKSGDK